MSEDVAANKAAFQSLLTGITREGIAGLSAWLESSDFYTAPASTRYHGAVQGGLCGHSLRVYRELEKLMTLYEVPEITEESRRIAALFHDLCKVNFYAVEKRNRKNEDGRWESYDAYTVDEKFRYGGHGSKSVYIVQSFMRLTPEEAIAINCHMSSWDGDKYAGGAYEQHPFAWLLHVADEAATYIFETETED